MRLGPMFSAGHILVDLKGVMPCELNNKTHIQVTIPY